MAKIKIDIYDKWDKERVKQLLINNDNAVLRALLALYNLQLPEEIDIRASIVENGKGFSKWDAPYLTDMAKAVKLDKKLEPKQISYIRSMILKYSGQLADIANEKDKQLEWKL